MFEFCQLHASSLLHRSICFLPTIDVHNANKGLLLKSTKLNPRKPKNIHHILV